MRIVIIIQARTGSTRLPGKVLKLLGDRTVLGHVIARCKAIPSVNSIIVATTNLLQDEAICDESIRNGITYYRGSETDVLSRYYEAAISAQADTVIRITSDCPLLDPEVVHDLIVFFQEQQYDYARIGLDRFPRGLDAEIFTYDALRQAYEEAAGEYDREHVTPYILNRPERFNIGIFRGTEGDEKDARFRLTLDTAEDWQLISEVYKRLYRGELFYWQDVRELLYRNPQLVRLNANVEQKNSTI